ncbi:MAG: PIG-L deacetylase family protein [Dehalococcoidia bacterium]|jgi:LmbE family N-acetylglucosaminyl deacetylase|nr:PIG-L deacetylase family protein [Dehalococcoidia bacterium]MDP7201903.1 PIG-L deacetylase family protein [Dehalococcoidia bacterium]HJN87982.1 PIG-L deacetylase family protein [Dehalococcoidia bacterium]
MDVLVISTHPDDETLGCGGTLLKHRAAGSKLFWLVATEAHEPRWSAEVIERKAVEVQSVAKAYGVEQCFKLGLPTVMLDTLPQDNLIGKIRDVVDRVKPEVVYLVHGGDVHTDHKAVFTATMSVLKPFYMSRLGVRRVLCYETLSSTEAAPPQHDWAFVPNVFSDVSPYLENKLEIMGLYATEIQEELLPRGLSAIRALARYRGATVGVEYAEAFQLVRELV